jgi:hypothetical protein
MAGHKSDQIMQVTLPTGLLIAGIVTSKPKI